MGTIEDIRKIAQDFLAPELGRIDERLKALEKKVDENELRAIGRHGEVMAAIHQVTDYAAVLARLAQLEARIQVQPHHQ